MIWPTSQEAISKRGGGEEGHAKVIQQLRLRCWEKQSSFVLCMAVKSTKDAVFPIAESRGKEQKKEPKDFNIVHGNVIISTPGSHINLSAGFIIFRKDSY